MLASSIGFLFVTQMITASQNITTLESFTDGITEKVIIYFNLRIHLIDCLRCRIYVRFLGVHIGFYQLILFRMIVR